VEAAWYHAMPQTPNKHNIANAKQPKNTMNKVEKKLNFDAPHYTLHGLHALCVIVHLYPGLR
jgi:hypothetical protein